MNLQKSGHTHHFADTTVFTCSRTIKFYKGLDLHQVRAEIVFSRKIVFFFCRWIVLRSTYIRNQQDPKVRQCNRFLPPQRRRILHYHCSDRRESLLQINFTVQMSWIINATCHAFFEKKKSTFVKGTIATVLGLSARQLSMLSNYFWNSFYCVCPRHYNNSRVVI